MEEELINILEENNYTYDKIDNEKDLELVYNLFKHDKMIENVENLNSTIITYVGFYYKLNKDYENMIKYFLMAIEEGNSIAITNLCYYYGEIKDYENMIKYYLIAIENGNSFTMTILGSYYYKIKDYNNMLKYFLMAIDKDNYNAMNFLGLYYQEIKDYENMFKYYLMAIEKGNIYAIENMKRFLINENYISLYLSYIQNKQNENKYNNDNDCPICLENNNNDSVILTCGHNYCLNCLQILLNDNKFECCFCKKFIS